MKFVLQSFNGHTWCTISKPRDEEKQRERYAALLRAVPEAKDRLRIALVEGQ